MGALSRLRGKASERASATLNRVFADTPASNPPSLDLGHRTGVETGWHAPDQ
jgi:hypothetical protein